jgi:hypothetical protein
MMTSASISSRTHHVSVIDLVTQRVAVFLLRWSRARVDRAAFTHQQMTRRIEIETARQRAIGYSPLVPR